jgi:hypothetical protein
MPSTSQQRLIVRLAACRKNRHFNENRVIIRSNFASEGIGTDTSKLEKGFAAQITEFVVYDTVIMLTGSPGPNDFLARLTLRPS